MLIIMSNKGLNRLPLIQAVISKRLRRRDMASYLVLTWHNVQWLLKHYHH